MKPFPLLVALFVLLRAGSQQQPTRSRRPRRPTAPCRKRCSTPTATRSRPSWRPRWFSSTPRRPGARPRSKSWSGYFEEKRLELLQWKPDRGQAAASGELAWTSGPYDYQRTGPDGKVAHFAGRYLTLWQKLEGKWQVWADGSWLEPANGGLGAQLA